MSNYIFRLTTCFILLVFPVIPHAVLAQAQNQAKALQVGILPISTTRVLIKNYQPLKTYLEHELKRPVELVTAHDFRTFHFNTIAGQYDIVITAAHLGRLAQTQANYVPLARYKAPHRTLLIVAKDLPLKSLQDLRGKVVAGIDPITLAMNESMLWLRSQGLRAGTDFTLLETPSPISAAYSLKNHQSVMAISSPQGMKQLPDDLKDSIEIFASLPELPSLMWLAHPRMAAELPKLKAALLGFTPASTEGAKFYAATGYIGMREVSKEETLAMEPIAQEVNILLQRKK
jgi:phosphonate transport system substrate-binding protein